MFTGTIHLSCCSVDDGKRTGRGEEGMKMCAGVWDDYDGVREEKGLPESCSTDKNLVESK